MGSRILEFSAFTLCLVLLYSCSYVSDNTITKIELATGYCHGECPFSAIYLDTTLIYKYYGGDFSDKKGFYKGIANKRLFEAWSNRLIQVKYSELDSVYTGTVDDQSVELIVQDNRGVKHIRGQIESLPKNVRDVFYQIANSYKQVKLKAIQDSIKFNTTVQYLPKVKPKFLPPLN
jgi:hypothetical protein